MWFACDLSTLVPSPNKSSHNARLDTPGGGISAVVQSLAVCLHVFKGAHVATLCSACGDVHGVQGSQKTHRQLKQGKLPKCATGRPEHLLLGGCRCPRQEKALADAITRDCLAMPRQECPALDNVFNMRVS